jgi:hypothetical protein
VSIEVDIMLEVTSEEEKDPNEDDHISPSTKGVKRNRTMKSSTGKKLNSS